MVASFPEFEYTKNRSSKSGCVPSAPQKPNRLRSSVLLSKSSADSSLLRKILSFHGSFRHSTPANPQKSGTLFPGFGDPASILQHAKSTSDSSAACRSNPREHNAAAKDSNSVKNMGRKWSSCDFASSNSSAWGSQQTNSGTVQDGDLLRTGCDPDGASEMGNFASKAVKSCSPARPVVSQLGNLSGQDGKFRAHDGDRIGMDDHAQRIKSGCGTQPCDSVNDQGNAEKPISVDVGRGCVAQSMVEDGGGGEVKILNSAYQSRIIAGEASSNGACNAAELAEAARTKENLRKVSSNSAQLVASNFSSENYPLYASDNSSNNLRWSSTSCTSTDTCSSNSTRRNSCESRVSSAVPPAFLAKPHKAHDIAWAAIRSLQLRQGGAPLAISHFDLIRRVGHGDIGSVFLAHLKDKLVASPLDASCLFAIKIMDKDALSQRSKLQRMHMEKEILECLDHPFLPTLYAHFNSEHFSCLVMDFCPGGDLYALRQKQPGKRFGLIAARFYAAEVLLALEYLHMLGIVYRDLKPENVLVRDDGHIMLTDFDLSLKAHVQPELVKHPLLSSASLSNSSSKKRLLRSYSQSSTISSSTTSFLHHESAHCRLPAPCSIDPIISCLTLTNTASKRAPQVPKHNSPIGYSMLSSKVSKASHSHTLSHKDGSISEPRKISKQDVLHSESTLSTPWNDDANANDNKGDATRGAKISSLCPRSNTSHPHHSTQVSKESHGNPYAEKSHGTEAALTLGLGSQEDPLMFMELVAEPTQARSMSFVGTHEYLAPEIIAGYGHGSPVDWWTFGVFLYELLYGRSPFKGASNDQTLINIIRQSLRFPEIGGDIDGMEDAKSLIQGLLMKDPKRRLGCTKGAAEIKQHAFFKGVNWALIRCTQPPEVPSPSKKGMHASSNHHHHSKSLHQFDYF